MMPYVLWLPLGGRALEDGSGGIESALRETRVGRPLIGMTGRLRHGPQLIRTPVDVVRQIDLICVPQLMRASADERREATGRTGRLAVRQATECSLRRVCR
jgi:hypothetical protein